MMHGQTNVKISNKLRMFNACFQQQEWLRERASIFVIRTLSVLFSLNEGFNLKLNEFELQMVSLKFFIYIILPIAL